MKKTLIALAAVAATSAAFAQSSVTLFGIVDTSIASVKNGGDSLTTMSNDGSASSRIGFRGVEDLGGGLSAEFWLESALSADNGGAALNFQRKSTIGLKGGFGEVRLGRDYTPTFSNHVEFTAFGTNGLGNSLNTLLGQGVTSILSSGSTTSVRANDSIGYFSPNFGGFTAQLMMGLKEANTPNSPNEYSGLRLRYAGGPLSASIATASEGSGNQVNSLKRTNLGVAYDFGFIKPMLFRVDAKFGAAKISQTGVGVTAPVGPGTVKFQYIRADENAAAGNKDATHYAVGYDYPLSKRTAIYGTYARISNKAGASYVLGNNTNGAAQVVGGASSGYAVGVRHSF